MYILNACRPGGDTLLYHTGKFVWVNTSRSKSDVVQLVKQLNNFAHDTYKGKQGNLWIVVRVYTSIQYSP